MIIIVTGHADSYKQVMTELAKTPDVAPSEVKQFLECVEAAQLCRIDKTTKVKIIGFAHAAMNSRERLLCELSDYTMIGTSLARFVNVLHKLVNPPVIDRNNPKHVRPL